MDHLEKIFEKDIPTEWRWERIRNYRNLLLAQSDFRMIEDAPWDKNAWAIYRQALRDLPKNIKDPLQVIFPEQPSV